MPGLMLVKGDGTTTRMDFMAGSTLADVAANGGTSLVCSGDLDGSFGFNRAAFHPWCRTVSPDGTMGPRAEIGYRSNFLSLPVMAYGGGFAVNAAGGEQQEQVALSAVWEHLAILGLDGTIKQQFATNLPAPSGDTGAPTMVIAGGCVDLIDFDVAVYNAPDAEHSTLQRFCEAPCP